jgi:hypothetical protein
VQHFVIEPQNVETDDEIGALQILEEAVHLFLAVNCVIAAPGAERHADAHAHAIDVAPAAHFLGGLLRFEIEINNVFHFGVPSAGLRPYLRYRFMAIKPFAALRPKPELAARICELPYDVMSSDEARAPCRRQPAQFSPRQQAGD